MAALDAAVAGASDVLQAAHSRWTVAICDGDAKAEMKSAFEIAHAENALIAAAEARGAARERGRECVWRYGSSYMATTGCGVKAAIADRRCQECGGRVRVEGVGDAE
jgi:hypothetical protein